MESSEQHDRYFMFGIKKDKQKLHASYRIGRIIGDGNFAIVRECTHRKSSKPYALKIINKAKVKGKEHMIENEIHILRKIIHPNIVKLHEEFETIKEIYLVMELVTGGDLFDSIVANTRFSEPCSAFMIRDLTSAVKYLHELNIVHRDIKPENLLVVNRKDGRRSIKLADFGLSIEVKKPLFLVCGTPTYVAPEILDESGYGLKVDVWAIGVICYILLCGFPPFRSANHDQEELFDKILRGDYEYLAPFWDDVACGPKDLIDCLLVVDSSERYDAEEILNHYWIKQWVEPVDTRRPEIKKQPSKRIRRRFQTISLAVLSFTSLLQLVRSRRQQDAFTNQDGPRSRLNTDGSGRSHSMSSRIPRPKSSAGLHIAEIRKSIHTPRSRISPEQSEKNGVSYDEGIKPAPSPECSLKKGFLKREEKIKRVFRSDNKTQYYSGSQVMNANKAAKMAAKPVTVRPSSAVSRRNSKSNDSEGKRLFIPRPAKHSNLFNSNNTSYASSEASSDSGYKGTNKSCSDTPHEIPVRRRSTNNSKLRPRSMIETSNSLKAASSEANIGNISNMNGNLHSSINGNIKSYTHEQAKPRRVSHSAGQRSSLRNKDECNCGAKKSGNSDGYMSRGYQTDSETQRVSSETTKCSCSSTRHASRYSQSQTNLESQKIFSSGEFSNLENASSNVRKSRSSCRKIPRKPVFRHASSIQSLSSEKYAAARRGLYRVKSLESNNALCAANKSSSKQAINDPSLPPWNPSTNVNSRLQSPMSPKRSSNDRKSFGKVDKVRSSPKHTATETDKGIKITTEVNKRKNIKFPDGKTVDEEVKTTTTVSVNNYPQEEECKEESLLAKVKNLAIEIGSLAKVTYDLSSESSTDSLITNGISITAAHAQKDNSDLTDNLAKEETDRFSETEYLSAFRKN